MVLPDPSNPLGKPWADELTRRLRNYNFADKCGGGSGGSGSFIAQWNGATVVSNAATINFDDSDAVSLVVESPPGTAVVNTSEYALLSGRVGGQVLNGGTAAGEELLFLGSSYPQGGSVGFFNTSQFGVSLNALGRPRLIIGGNSDPTDQFVPGGIVPFVLEADYLNEVPVVAAFPLWTVSGDGNGSLILGIQSQGTLAVPTTTVDGARLLTFSGAAYDTDNVLQTNLISILLETDGPMYSGSGPGALYFTINLTDRFKLDRNGQFSFGDNFTSPTGRMDVQANDNEVAMVTGGYATHATDLHQWVNANGIYTQDILHTVDEWGREGASGAAAGVTSCGSSPTISGNDQAGIITVGSGISVISCTLSFSNTFDGVPSCFAVDESQVLALRVVPSTTTATIDAALSFDGDTIRYGCPIYLRNTSTPTGTATPTITPTP